MFLLLYYSVMLYFSQLHYKLDSVIPLLSVNLQCRAKGIKSGGAIIIIQYNINIINIYIQSFSFHRYHIWYNSYYVLEFCLFISIKPIDRIIYLKERPALHYCELLTRSSLQSQGFSDGSKENQPELPKRLIEKKKHK